MRIPNPITTRLEFVRRQYGDKAYEKTREIVARNLGIAKEEIHPGQRVDWEKFIPWLGKQVHALLKKQRAGIPVESEFQKLERGFLASIQPFMVKKKGRGPDIGRLSPKQARQFAGRRQRAVGEVRAEQAREKGYKTVARLGNGYTAVVATVGAESPEIPFAISVAINFEPEANQRVKKWVENHAPFQQWLGVELGNCLQFYRVNYEPHGTSQYAIQRAGGKLYGILDPKGKPVAAILTNPDGTIRETNGPGNRPPPEKDQEYVDRFIQKHLKQDVRDMAFQPPEGFPEVTGVIEYLLDYWPEGDVRGRRRFLRKAQGYARQQGADFSKVWPKFAIYILEESKYSALASVKKTEYSKKSEAIVVIKRVANLYRNNGSIAQFEKARAAAAEAAWAAEATAVATAVWAATAAARAAGARAAEAAGARAAEARANFASKLLELMRDAARAAGGAQPRDRRAGNPTTARALIKECQRLWEHYCERPGVTRLRAVTKHCEAMKSSRAATVAAERRRCMRSVRAEARQHKWSL